MATRSKKQFPIVKLSPSNSSKWLNCDGYAQACAGLGDGESSDAAELGTAAHALLELSIRMDVWDVSELRGVQVNLHEADEEMIEAVQTMLTWIKEWMDARPNSILKTEQGVELMLGDYLLTGTADVLLYDPDEQLLVVPDYKHGAGIWVDAHANSQVGLYILAALRTLKELGFTVTKAIGAICQPRVVYFGRETIRFWEPTAEDLRGLMSRAIEAAHRSRLADPPRTPGTHCKRCAVESKCKALAEYILRTGMADFEDLNERPIIDPKDPQSMTPDGIAYVLKNIPIIDSWLRACEAEATRRLIRHLPMPGSKLVAGRTYRKWINPAKVQDTLLQNGFEIDVIAPRELLGPAPVDLLLKKRKDEKLASRILKLTTKTVPKLSLAPEGDPRPALIGTASLDFKPLSKVKTDT